MTRSKINLQTLKPFRRARRFFFFFYHIIFVFTLKFRKSSDSELQRRNILLEGVKGEGLCPLCRSEVETAHGLIGALQSLMD